MDIFTRLNKSKLGDHAVVILVLLPAFIMYYDRFSPEAAVYFTYFKNFFSRPFSFQADQVAFGATSPLHVLIHAPIHALFGSSWIFFSKLLNFLFVGFGVVVLNRTLKGGIKSVLLTSLFVVLSAGMLISVSQLFETGLAFLAMALLYHDLCERKYERGLLICGMMYLIRPELIFVGIFAAFYIMIQSDNSKKLVPWLLAGIAPAVAYHAYMLAATGSLVPAGVMTWIIAYIQEPSSWLSRFGTTLSVLWSAPGLIYVAGAALILVMLAEWSAPRYFRELMLVFPLVALFMLLPPGEEIVRYLVPTLPVLIAIFVRYIDKELKVQHTSRALLVMLVLAHVFGAATLSATLAADRQGMFMSDLTRGINRLAGQTDHVLLYDIQNQYEIEAPCHGLSGNVGDEMVDVLLRRIGVDELIRRKKIRFVVTSDPLGQHPIYAQTLLSELYEQDPWLSVGDTVAAGGLVFEKQLSSSAFTSRAAHLQSASRGGSDQADRQVPVLDTGPLPRWNSVFRVLGDAAAIEAEGAAMAALDTFVEPVDGPDLVIDTLDKSAAPQVDDQKIDVVDSAASP